MLPSFKEDEKIILTWLKSDNSLYYVTKNGIFRARVDKPERSVEPVMKMKEPVLSAWFSNLSGQLSLLSLSSIIVVDPRSWRTVREQSVVFKYNEDAWICEVPGSWLVSLTGHQIMRQVHIVYQSGALTIVDTKYNKTWNKKTSFMSRGQFLVKFINHMMPTSLMISSFTQLTALVPQSLRCSFLQSSIEDIQWNSETLIIRTTKKEVWKISRNPNIALNRLLSNCSLICLMEDVLTSLTSDGAVYNLITTDESHGLKSEDGVLSLEKVGNIYNNLQTHANYLEAVGEMAETLDAQIAQLQCYHLLSNTPPDDMNKMLALSVDVDVERKILNCTVKATSSRLKLQGKFWIVQTRVLGRNSEENWRCWRQS